MKRHFRYLFLVMILLAACGGEENKTSDLSHPKIDGGFVFGSEKKCPAGTELIDGKCQSRSTGQEYGNGGVTEDCDECSTEGKWECVDEHTSRVCVRDSSGCLVWMETACPENSTCVNGKCYRQALDGGQTETIEDSGITTADGGIEDGGTGVCANVTCSGHGHCVEDDSSGTPKPKCVCDEGYESQGVSCVPAPPDAGVVMDAGVTLDAGTGPCAGIDCSGHGRCIPWPSGPICACDKGYTPSNRKGLDCVPTNTVCKGGPLNPPYDYDDDGKPDDYFEPSSDECYMYELINFTRATHDPEGSPECHTPLMYNLLWSAHARNHSIKMKKKGGLFHADSPMGQNCAYGCGPDCEMDMYMNGAGEDHCPDLSHHCNIMRCSFSQVGVGYEGTYNTQNFL